MESRYSPSEIESNWHQNWKNSKAFSPKGEGEPFAIVIPPPNVTGALHLGHALNNTIQDILVRWQRKLGKKTLWIPGTDHAGIATQAVVEKRLFQDEGKTRHDIGREALIEKIWAWKDEYEKRISRQLQKMGASCDWERQRFTLDPICAKAVRHAFFELFKKRLIYRGKRLVNWDTHLQTAVADDEINHETVKGHMWYFHYPLSDGSGSLTVATTRPETILGDTAVAVHPHDDRYKHLIGKKLKVPFVNREIDIIADGQLVNPEFGTGCVKVTPAHDPNDYQTGLRHNLEQINIMTTAGLVNENGGPFAGLTMKVAREKVIAGLEELNLLEKTEDHEHQVGHSDRSATAIEPFLSDQWFVKMENLAENAMDVVKSEEIKFHPPRFAKSYLDWLSEKRDWCISRQLWWGHQIPIWYNTTASAQEMAEAFDGKSNISYIDTEKGWLICAQEEDLAEDTIPGHKLTRDPDVLDTWFSSALWPMSTMGWPSETEDLSSFYPTSVLSTARDIISLWVARMVVFGLENKQQIPFKHVYIHPTILDGKGQRMSKSKGNGVDPLDIIEEYGTDALRYTMATLATENQDARLPVKEKLTEDGRKINTSEKFELGRNFANKLWNACRFVYPHLETRQAGNSNPALYTLEDKWIRSRVATTVEGVSKALEGYKFAEAAQILYHFTWDDFCSRYLEIKKKILTGAESAEKQNSLVLFVEVLDQILGVLHPFMPFITEEIHKILLPTAGDLISKAWPISDVTAIDLHIEKSFTQIFGVVESVRSVKGQYSLSPAEKVKCVVHFDNANDIASLEASRELVTSMARLGSFKIEISSAAPKFSACKIITGGQVYVPLEGILDKDKEIDKLTKEIDKTSKFIFGLEKKLSNAKFVSNAPATVVDGEKNKLANQQDILLKAQKALAELQ